MLAHRVGQHYGLQTSTVDYEECAGRVIGVRTQHAQAPKVRPSNELLQILERAGVATAASHALALSLERLRHGMHQAQVQPACMHASLL